MKAWVAGRRREPGPDARCSGRPRREMDKAPGAVAFHERPLVADRGELATSAGQESMRESGSRVTGFKNLCQNGWLNLHCRGTASTRGDRHHNFVLADGLFSNSEAVPTAVQGTVWTEGRRP
jgi:hypothetical protein